jgi:hypothetical protein
MKGNKTMKTTKKRILSLLIAACMLLSIAAVPTTAVVEDVSTMPIMPSETIRTPAGYNNHDFQRLVAFALQDDNLEKLGWDLTNPSTFEEIEWVTSAPPNSALFVHNIDFTGENYEGLGLTGTLDVSGMRLVRDIYI